MKNLLFIILIVVLSASTSVFIYEFIHNSSNAHDYNSVSIPSYALEPAQLVNFTPNSSSDRHEINIDFQKASARVSPVVVHILTKKQASSYTPQQQKWEAFGENNPSRNYNDTYKGSTGSGVIVGKNGYIITNNHVIKGGVEITVELFNKKSYNATIIGIDSATDLALLKITATNLPVIEFADSDLVNIGEWVLAVGNPFNLTSTVTAGIVSAKARAIQVLKEDSAIESFIQTDAVVNPGSSGGALVNTVGSLIGINTAISSRDGTYDGYSFAIPSNIVSKVFKDLKEHGVVQRAYLGIIPKDIDATYGRTHNHPSLKGVLVHFVHIGSSAGDSDIKKGDIILEINGYEVNSSAELVERIARTSPGDNIAVTYLRNGVEKYAEVTLKNADKNTETVKKKTIDVLEKKLGAKFKNLSVSESKRWGLPNGGVKVIHLSEGILTSETSMKKGFVILKVNNNIIGNKDELNIAISKAPEDHGVMLEGLYLGEKRRTLYAFKK